jgi:hypothetical protein
MPPGGPKLADLSVESICGEEVECFSARRWRMGGMLGDFGTSKVDALSRSELFVFRLSWLGFRLIAGIWGLINDGELGSIAGAGATAEDEKTGWIERPFKFRGFLGEGEVMGRKTGFISGMAALDVVAGTAILDMFMPKVVEG